MILLFFLALWIRAHSFMDHFPGSKKEYYGEKMTIIFPFLPQMVDGKKRIKKDFSIWGEERRWG
jgi:hypothetical protein